MPSKSKRRSAWQAHGECLRRRHQVQPRVLLLLFRCDVKQITENDNTEFWILKEIGKRVLSRLYKNNQGQAKVYFG